MVSLKQFLKDVHDRGVRVGEHPDYGGVNNALHMAGSMHGKGRAGDLNYGPAGDSAEERDMLRWAARLADAAGLNVIYAHHRTHPIAKTNAAHRGHAHVDDGRIAAYRPPHPGGNDSLYRKILAERRATGAPSRDDDRDPVKPSTKKRKPSPLQTVRRGSKGFPVILLQRRLKGNGVYKGAIDNNFGPATEAAVKDFQRSRGLKVDGVVGPHTWYELAQGAKSGSTGKWRNKIAQRVVGLREDEADGVIGPQSDERIREVQRWLGVKDDGVLGPKTVEALIRKA